MTIKKRKKRRTSFRVEDNRSSIVIIRIIEAWPFETWFLWRNQVLEDPLQHGRMNRKCCFLFYGPPLATIIYIHSILRGRKR